MPYADSKETVPKQEFSRRFAKESITKNQALDVKRNLKLLENVNITNMCRTIMEGLCFINPPFLQENFMWWNRIIFGIDGYEVVMWFLTYSMMGWLVESIYMSFCNHKITNRGFAKGPFCPIYGFGALTVFFILRPYSDNSILLFFLGSFLATTLEFLTALVMKRIFGEIWWDYHEKPFNYRGIICLESSIAWGFYTLFLFMFLQNIVAAFVAMIPVRAGRVIGNLILIGYIMDFSATIYRQKKENLQESMDEEQIQQIEQAKDKMKDNFLT